MMTLVEPPRDRELPPGVHECMRARVLQEIERPAPRAGRGWRAAPVAVVAVAAAVVAGPLLVDRDDASDGPPAVVAFGVGRVSARLEQVIAECERTAYGSNVGITPGTLRLVNRGEAGDYAIAVFLAGTERMVVCDGDATGGGGHYGPFWQAHWLPGPVSVESVSISDLDRGDVFVAGRVSERVARLELAHGDGRTTVARLSEGTFAVATNVGDLVIDAAALVAYDKADRIIDRRPAVDLTSGNPKDDCYTDAAGAVVYGAPGPDCRPADPWP